jgi:hypothetical protein
MHNSRFRLMAGLAGATLCLFAVTTYGQNTNTAPTGAAGAGSVTTQTTPGDATAQPPATTGTNATPSTAAGTTDGTITRSTATDVSTTTTTTSFPGGLLGIFAVVVLVLLVLFAVFRGRDRTVVRETYASSSTARNVGPGTAADDRMNLNPRAASGTGTNSGGPNDPNART